MCVCDFKYLFQRRALVPQKALFLHLQEGIKQDFDIIRRLVGFLCHQF